MRYRPNRSHRSTIAAAPSASKSVSNTTTSGTIDSVPTEGWARTGLTRQYQPMSEIGELFAKVVGDRNVTVGDAISDDYAHDEALTATWSRPVAVVRPGN